MTYEEVRALLIAHGLDPSLYLVSETAHKMIAAHRAAHRAAGIELRIVPLDHKPDPLAADFVPRPEIVGRNKLPPSGHLERSRWDLGNIAPIYTRRSLPFARYSRNCVIIVDLLNGAMQ